MNGAAGTAMATFTYDSRRHSKKSSKTSYLEDADSTGDAFASETWITTNRRMPSALYVVYNRTNDARANEFSFNSDTQLAPKEGKAVMSAGATTSRVLGGVLGIGGAGSLIESRKSAILIAFGIILLIVALTMWKFAKHQEQDLARP